VIAARVWLAIALVACEPNDAADAGLAVACGDAVVREGLGCEVLGGLLLAPRDVWVTDDGAIVATELGAGRIVRLEDGAWVPIAEGLSSPIGLREASDGRLIVGEEAAGSVSWIDPVSGARTPIAADLGNVTYVAGAPDGTLFVSSFGTTAPVGSGVVHRVDPESRSATPFATGLHVPEGLFVGGDGTLVVAEWQLPSAILRFPSGGGDVVAATVEATGFEHVYGLASDGAGGIFVGDHAGRVVHVRSDGTRDVLLDRIGRPGGITRHPSGELLVVEFVDFGAMGRVFRLRGL
jgi:sugar lactone lactonase YvrE